MQFTTKNDLKLALLDTVKLHDENIIDFNGFLIALKTITKQLEHFNENS